MNHWLRQRAVHDRRKEALQIKLISDALAIYRLKKKIASIRKTKP